jgi:hypothetical protein
MNFEQELERDETEWKDWSLLAGDGQAAVIMKLISDRAVSPIFLFMFCVSLNFFFHLLG